MVRGGASVALVERTHYDDPRWGETVSPAIRRPLDHLGVWDHFRQSPHRPLAWRGELLGLARSRPTETSCFDPWRKRLAPRSPALRCDARRRVRWPPAPTLWRARVEGAQWASGSWQVATTEGPLHARVLINAAGRQASFRMPVAGRRRFSDHSVVVVQVFKTDGSMPSGWTVIEATADGWAYTPPSRRASGRDVLHRS